jgi:fructosamine-3-kinase
MSSSDIKGFLKDCLSPRSNPEDLRIGVTPVGGGSINKTYRVSLDHKSFFLKYNSAEKFPLLLEKEKKGLAFLASQGCILTPGIIACEVRQGQQFLLLEWIESGSETKKFWKKFGEQLAALHHVAGEYSGFSEDNYMGSLPQANTPRPDWVEFFIHCRLQPQIELARTKKLLQKRHVDLFEALYQNLDAVFGNEKPSLLHGDLWSGNFICNEKSMPVLIDPAVYYGHRSMDLAMTTLFGGFDKDFYEAYHFHFPFPPNYHEQWQVCNLYPLLVHLNLFGSGYLNQIEKSLNLFS